MPTVGTQSTYQLFHYRHVGKHEHRVLTNNSNNQSLINLINEIVYEVVKTNNVLKNWWKNAPFW